MGFSLSRLLTAGGYVGAGYLAAILVAVLVGCLADAPRRADARRVLALLLRHQIEPDTPKPRPRGRGAVGARRGKGSAELPAGSETDP